MKMTIKPNAIAFLENKIPRGSFVLLALNDGSNKYSDIGGTCTIGANFQLVILKEKDPAFTVPVENNDELEMYTSPDEQVFLQDSVVLDEKYGMLVLSDDTGIIDSAVTISTPREQPLSEEAMKDMGNKIC